jgi:prepilin-type N-terminal cleavage/methylation domain-containing protein
MKARTQKKGFTLIEILIVTVIIAILAAMGLVGYVNAIRNGRNARRVSDLNSIQAAFEQYFANNGTYDAGCDLMDDALQGGMPVDPNPELGAYSGVSACTTTTYCICAALGLAAGADSAKGANSTDDNCSFATSGNLTHFCVQQRLQ